MKRKIKIVHIHTDSKFLFTINKYSEELFDNRLIYLGGKSQIQNINIKYIVDLPSNNKKRFDVVKQECEIADIVIIYNLNSFAIKLIKSLPPKIKIIWRFFGWEIYSKHPMLIYSKMSLKTYRSEFSKLSFKNKVKHRIWELIYGKNSFEKAIKRIDYFKGIMDNEYELLLTLGYKLPPFLQVPLVMDKAQNSNVQEKSKLIIFGNSRGRTNNHLDIIELLKSVSLPEDLRIKMFFSYGPYEDYAQKVIKEASNIRQIEIIDKFLSKEEFEDVYNKAAALIINGYRQMAMGNIFTAIKYGVKVYLSEKNSTYRWLLHKNIKVFSIEKQLIDDVKKGEYFLSFEEKIHNTTNLNSLIDLYNINDFNQKIFDIVNPKD